MGHMIWRVARFRLLLAIPVALVLLFAPLGAIYVVPQIEQVPVSRVIGNLEKIAKAEPQNAQVRVNLARAHAMAYVLKTETLPMDRQGTTASGPAFRPGPGPWVPFAGEPSPSNASPSAVAAAREHLAAAIRAYEDALRLTPDDPIARLGYGWCLEQGGNRGNAIAAYRAVLELTWPLEKTKRWDNFRRTITEEAIDYLIRLLDAQRDREEIARLRGYLADAGYAPRAITPIVVPLNGSPRAHQLVELRARVRFDADGSALDREWSWITPDAGWLVYDHDGRGTITSALQLFGSVTFWMFWSNGYEALSALDDTQDGRLAGDELKGLAIWHDANANGVSERGEVRGLAEWGIVALSTSYRAEDESDVYVAESPDGVTFIDGTTRPTYDVLLHRLSEGRRSTPIGGSRHKRAKKDMLF
jgi:tetratricopeptide (TPR) repeat protein